MIQTKIKPLNPRSPDQKYMGDEPAWPHPEGMTRMTAVGRAWHWYNYYYGKKDVKQMILAWLAHNDRMTEHCAFARVPDITLTNVTGWLCRMNMRGLELEDNELEHINTEIRRHIETAKSVRQIVISAEDTAPKVTIQDRLRNRTEEIAGELECMYDDMINNGAKMSSDYKPIAIIRGMNLPPQMTGMIRDIWQTRLTELETVQAGRDADLIEGFSNFSKVQIRSLIKITEQVLADLASYVQIKRVEKKPRKVKIVSPEHRARKFKHVMEFPELNLIGLPAAKLIDASEAWLYDTKKRKLIHLVADTHIGSVTIKNNMLVGFSDAESQQKTLRRPADTIKALMAASKPNARKLFKDVKTTETAFNGRGTENLMILRVW